MSSCLTVLSPPSFTCFFHILFSSPLPHLFLLLRAILSASFQTHSELKCKGHTNVWDQWLFGGKARRAGVSRVIGSHEGWRSVLALPVADYLAGPGAGRATMRE